jgi:hypothetical protein
MCRDIDVDVEEDNDDDDDDDDDDDFGGEIESASNFLFADVILTGDVGV